MNNEKDLNALGSLIKSYRLSYPMNSSELANKVGVAQSYISDLENGKKKKPRLDILEKIVNILGNVLPPREKTSFYLNVLTFAGLREERNKIVHQEIGKDPIPLADFLRTLEKEENRPLDNQEFLLVYKDKNNNIKTIRNYSSSFEALFDLYNIGSKQEVNTKKENGIGLIGKSSTYYKGRELTKDEIKQVKKLIGAILNNN